MFPSAVTEYADVVLPVAAAPEKAGSLPRLGGPRRAPSTPPCTAPGSCPTAGCCRAWPTRWTSTCGCPPPRRPAPSSPPSAPRAVPARASGLDVAPAGRRRRCRRPGRAGLLAAAARRRHAAARRAGAGRHRPPAGGPDRRRTPPRRLGLADGDRLTVSGATGSVTLPVAGHRDARPGRLAADARHRAARSGPTSAPGPAAWCSCPPATRRRRCPMTVLATREPADARGLRARRLVDRAHQDRRHLRRAGLHDAVRDRVRAQGRRPDAAADRPQPGRPARLPAEPGRRAEAGVQGRHHAGAGRQAGVLPGPGHRRRSRRSSRSRSSRSGPRSASSATTPRCSSPMPRSAC